MWNDSRLPSSLEYVMLDKSQPALRPIPGQYALKSDANLFLKMLQKSCDNNHKILKKRLMIKFEDELYYSGLTR
ncbi:5193_t:CDS:2 [Cetraspora pellucida]|uniref:5193_t:CDS:1 n=1 Tax=Cetraspora pellucida TaxID=1433469 RepID=A0A9N9NBE7_9GLOM|nr:5193_t:CDS:2 [Cetraspora pellucida]